MDIVKTSTDEIIEAYFEKIQSKMAKGDNPFLAIKIAHRFFKERKVTHKETLPVLADKLQKSYAMLELIIFEIKDYSEKVDEIVR